MRSTPKEKQIVRRSKLRISTAKSLVFLIAFYNVLVITPEINLLENLPAILLCRTQNKNNLMVISYQRKYFQG